MKSAIFTRAHEMTRRSRQWHEDNPALCAMHGFSFNYRWEFRGFLNSAWNEYKDSELYVNYMEIAHALTRAAIQPGDDYRVTFAAALRIAYAEAAASAAAEWAAKTPEEQYNALLAMAWHEYGQRDARSMIRDGQPVQLPNVFTWIDPRNPGDDMRAVAHDAALRLVDMIDPAAAVKRYTAEAAEHDERAAAIRAGLDAIKDRAELNRAITEAMSEDEAAAEARAAAKRAARNEERDTQSRPLSRLLSRAVIMAAQKIDRAERRNPNGRRVKRDADGAPVINPAADPDRPDADLYLYEIQTDSPTAAPLPQPESMAIARDSISRAARDDIDRAIMDALARGYSAREIAPRVGMSHTAVNKRIAKLRQRYAAEA